MAQARLHNEVMVAYDIEDSKNRTKLTTNVPLGV
jgi:hypothetical protein